MTGEPMRVVVLASGGGSNLQALLDDQQGYRIVHVITDRRRAGALERAQIAGIPATAIPLTYPRDLEWRARWEENVAATISIAEPDLVVMAGWMRVMFPAFVHRFADRLINQHPALVPDNTADTYVLSDGRSIPAIRGAHAVRDALALGVPVTGCTVHWVTPAVDVGRALMRVEVPVLPDDDEESLHERIKVEERRMIVAVVRQLAAQHRSD